MNVLDVLYAQLMRDLFAIAKFFFTCVYCSLLLGAPVRAGFAALVSCFTFLYYLYVNTLFDLIDLKIRRQKANIVMEN